LRRNKEVVMIPQPTDSDSDAATCVDVKLVSITQNPRPTGEPGDHHNFLETVPNLSVAQESDLKRNKEEVMTPL
jgi:hypothetical protein